MIDWERDAPCQSTADRQIGPDNMKKMLSQNIEQPLICFASKQHLTDPNKKVSSHSAVELHAYVNRACATDHTGTVHDFTWRTEQDFVASQMYFPAHARQVPALRVWKEADKAAARTGRLTEVISTHMVCRLPATDVDVCFGLIGGFAEEHILSLGLIVEAAIHVPIIESPHVHFQISRRQWSADDAFSCSIYHATSFETLAKWRRGWINALSAHANQN